MPGLPDGQETPGQDGRGHRLHPSPELSGENPYRTAEGEGFLPFSFVHYKFPATDFHASGPGRRPARLNDYCNYDLDDIGDGKRYLSKPIGVARGVSPLWTPPAEIRPGIFLNLSEDQAGDQMGNGPEGNLEYLTASPGWIAAN